MVEKRSDEINEIVKALVKVQAEIKNPKKEANNPFFKSKYSTLDSVIETYKELCSKNDLVVMENPVSKVTESGKSLIGVEILLMHSSGQFINFDPYLLSPVKNDPQGVGSSITYARRYTLSSVFNIASEDDDDGNSASGNVNKNAPRQTPPKQIAATQAEIGNLKKEIIAFSTLMTEQGKDVKPEQVEQTLNITDYAKLNSEDVKEAVNKLKGWSK